MSNLTQNLTWQGGGPRVENYKMLTMELSAVCTLSSTMGFGGYGRVIRATMEAISDENLPKPSLFHCCADSGPNASRVTQYSTTLCVSPERRAKEWIGPATTLIGSTDDGKMAKCASDAYETFLHDLSLGSLISACIMHDPASKGPKLNFQMVAIINMQNMQYM